MADQMSAETPGRSVHKAKAWDANESGNSGPGRTTEDFLPKGGATAILAQQGGTPRPLLLPAAGEQASQNSVSGSGLDAAETAGPAPSSWFHVREALPANICLAKSAAGTEREPLPNMPEDASTEELRNALDSKQFRAYSRAVASTGGHGASVAASGTVRSHSALVQKDGKQHWLRYSDAMPASELLPIKPEHAEHQADVSSQPNNPQASGRALSHPQLAGLQGVASSVGQVGSNAQPSASAGQVSVDPGDGSLLLSQRADSSELELQLLGSTRMFSSVLTINQALPATSLSVTEGSASQAQRMGGAGMGALGAEASGGSFSRQQQQQQQQPGAHAVDASDPNGLLLGSSRMGSSVLSRQTTGPAATGVVKKPGYWARGRDAMPDLQLLQRHVGSDLVVLKDGKQISLMRCASQDAGLLLPPITDPDIEEQLIAASNPNPRARLREVRRHHSTGPRSGGNVGWSADRVGAVLGPTRSTNRLFAERLPQLSGSNTDLESLEQIPSMDEGSSGTRHLQHQRSSMGRSSASQAQAQAQSTSIWAAPLAFLKRAFSGKDSPVGGSGRRSISQDGRDPMMAGAHHGHHGSGGAGAWDADGGSRHAMGAPDQQKGSSTTRSFARHSAVMGWVHPELDGGDAYGLVGGGNSGGGNGGGASGGGSAMPGAQASSRSLMTCDAVAAVYEDEAMPGSSQRWGAARGRPGSMTRSPSAALTKQLSVNNTTGTSVGLQAGSAGQVSLPPLLQVPYGPRSPHSTSAQLSPTGLDSYGSQNNRSSSQLLNRVESSGVGAVLPPGAARSRSGSHGQLSTKLAPLEGRTPSWLQSLISPLSGSGGGASTSTSTDRDRGLAAGPVRPNKSGGSHSFKLRGNKASLIFPYPAGLCEDELDPGMHIMHHPISPNAPMPVGQQGQQPGGWPGGGVISPRSDRSGSTSQSPAVYSPQGQWPAGGGMPTVPRMMHQQGGHISPIMERTSAASEQLLPLHDFGGGQPTAATARAKQGALTDPNLHLWP